MDDELNRLVHAIDLASNPASSNSAADRVLYEQAVNYLHTVQQNAAGDTVWKLSLRLFLDCDAGNARKYPPLVRLHALRLLEEFLDNKFAPLDDETFLVLKDAFLSYIQSEYVLGDAEASSTFLRNKFSHIFSLFFLATYQSQWPTFFTEVFALLRQPSPASQSQGLSINLHVATLLAQTTLETSSEISDQLLKSARSFTPERHARDGRVRDLVRERDAGRLNDVVVGVLGECVGWLEKEGSGRDSDGRRRVEETLEWNVKAFASYIHWIDITLTCTPTTVQLLFSLLSSTRGVYKPSIPIKTSTLSALQRMVSKGLKDPSDKLDLLRVLDCGKVLAVLEARTRMARSEETERDSEENEVFREACGRLCGALGVEVLDLVKEENPSQVAKDQTAQMIDELLPTTLQFLGDEYDDTSQTVFIFLHSLLHFNKKLKKSAVTFPPNTFSAFLRDLLGVLIEKARWDPDGGDPWELEEDERDQFESIRRDIRSFAESIYTLDPDLVTSSFFNYSSNILNAYQTGGGMHWNDAELGVWLILVYGDVARGPARGRFAFCTPPANSDLPPHSSKATGKPSDTNQIIRRQDIDYSSFPLTPQGQLMYSLVKSNLLSFGGDGATAVRMEVFESAVRYPDFFKVRKDCVVSLLEGFVDSRGVHNSNLMVRARAYYLFQRFIKDQRLEITPSIAQTILNAISDILSVDVVQQAVTDSFRSHAEESELPSDASINDILTEVVQRPTIFDSLVYVFEASGTLISLLSSSRDVLSDQARLEGQQQQTVFQNLVQPVLDDMQTQIQLYRSHTASPSNQDLSVMTSILKLHHDITVLGNLAKGFPDAPSSTPEGYVPPTVVVFQQIVEATLVTLDAMNDYKVIRDAARSAFTKIMAPAGPFIAHYIPGFMQRLIQRFESSELTDFMNFIGLLVHKLPNEMFAVVDELMIPLHSHISSILSQGEDVAAGTDEKIAKSEAKKGYMTFLNNVVVAKLQGVFTSERNQAHLEQLLEFIMSIAQDVSEPYSEKLAFHFLGRCIATWAQPAVPVNGHGVADPPEQRASIPGFERFIYDHVIPLAFKVPSLAEFNIKDGQMVAVCHEIANLLSTICKTRGDEAINHFLNVFLPSVQCPPETAEVFMNHMKDPDGRAFRKYFTDFVRSSKVPQRAS